ncbi:hypothetical protein AMTR_s00073p00179480 [Amborella trichopoda]|uniref:Uncharacterized protein n=1 Tax=Amborella trichopoda TaxID=13333 RepID=W1NNJ3_AMBTC|nr:hypothetical protein AMTR_s00073p00179480 [Amborella trichopoda]
MKGVAAAAAISCGRQDRGLVMGDSEMKKRGAEGERKWECSGVVVAGGKRDGRIEAAVNWEWWQRIREKVVIWGAAVV